MWPQVHTVDRFQGRDKHVHAPPPPCPRFARVPVTPVAHTCVCVVHMCVLYTCVCCTCVCVVHVCVVHVCVLYTCVCCTRVCVSHVRVLYTCVCVSHVRVLYTCVCVSHVRVFHRSSLCPLCDPTQRARCSFHTPPPHHFHSIHSIHFIHSIPLHQLGDLLKDWRRLNVAVSRARCKLIFVGNSHVMQQAVVMSRCTALFVLLRRVRWGSASCGCGCSPKRRAL